jgi:WD40 repeat protein
MTRFLLGGLVLLGMAPPAGAAQDSPSKVDAFGDLLPAGAIARLGTTRLRHGAPIVGLAWSHDSKVLASASHDKTICLWDVNDGKLVRRFTEPTDAVFAVALSQDGKWVAAAGRDHAVRVWDRASGKLRWSTKAHGQAVYSLAFSHDSRWLTSGGGVVRLWDAATGNAGQEFRDPTDTDDAIFALAFSPDDSLLAAGARDNGLRLWDVKSGKARHHMNTDPKRPVYGLAFSPDGQRLASAHGGLAGEGVPVHWWNTATGQRAGTLSGVGSTGLGVQFSTDGKALVVGPSEDKHNVGWFDLQTGKPLRTVASGVFPCYVATLSPDGKIVATAGRDSRIVLHDAATGKEWLPAVGAEAHSVQVAVPRQGTAVVAGTAAGSVRLFDLATGKALRTLLPPRSVRSVLYVSPDGQRLTVDDHTHGFGVRVVDIATGKDVGKPLSIDQSFFLHAQSGDGRFLATGSKREVLIWDIPVRKKVQQLPVDCFMAQLTFSPDGTWLLVSRLPGISDPLERGNPFTKSESWHVPSGKELAVWPATQPPPVDGLVFSADGRSVAGRSSLGMVGLWEFSTGLQRCQWPMPGNRALVTALSPDGRLLAVSGYRLPYILSPEDDARYEGGQGVFDGTLLLFDVATGKNLPTLPGHTGEVYALEFTGDGRHLISLGWDGTVLVWPVAAPQLPQPKLVKGRLEELTKQLTGDDAAVAWYALWTLVAAGDQATAHLRPLLSKVPPVDAATVTKYQQALESTKFADRDKATRELKEMGAAGEPILAALLAGKPTLELRLRVEPLLAPMRQPQPSPGQVRALRLLEVLERIGSKEARAVLADLAQGAPEAWLTRQAAGCVQRLDWLNPKKS